MRVGVHPNVSICVQYVFLHECALARVFVEMIDAVTQWKEASLG